jgi:glycogen(starch) synthase
VFGNHDLRQLFILRQRVLQFKRSFKPDLIHLHVSDPSVYFHLSTRDAFPAPTIVTIHQDTRILGLKGGMDTLLGNTLRTAEWVTTVSEATLADVKHIEPGIEGRSSVIYNGVDSPKRQPTALPFDPPRILCLGRLIDTKGVDLAITAFSYLLNRYPHARLTIAGEGPERASLERQVASLGLGEAVEFVGRIEPEEVPAVINQATVVIMPSRVEGFPMRALESAHMARPVVATPAGGLAEAIIHQQTGVIVEKENCHALAAAVVFLLDHQDVAVRMGRAARARVLRTFSLKHCADSYDRLYRKLGGIV